MVPVENGDVGRKVMKNWVRKRLVDKCLRNRRTRSSGKIQFLPWLGFPKRYLDNSIVQQDHINVRVPQELLHCPNGVHHFQLVRRSLPSPRPSIHQPMSSRAVYQWGQRSTGWQFRGYQMSGTARLFLSAASRVRLFSSLYDPFIDFS